MRRRLRALVLLACLAGPLPAGAQPAGECAVLLHGLGRTETPLVLMEDMLGADGLRVVNPGYPSTEGGTTTT